MDYSPSVDQFAEVLSQEPKWYSFGIFLGVPTVELKRIEQNYGTDIMRCLIELYSYLERKGEPLSWEIIATALRRTGNNTLADKIHSNYILPFIRRISSVSSKEDSTKKHQQEQQSVAMDRSTSDSHVMVKATDLDHVDFQIKDNRVEEVGGEFQSLTERFAFLASKIKRSFKAASTVDTEELQDLIEDLCGLAPLPQAQATFEAVFKRLKQHCSILNFRVLVLLVENLLSNEGNLRKELAKFTASVESFKKSAKMIELVSLIKQNQIVPDGNNKKVKLKVREFWSHFTMKQFETVMNEILDTLYDQLSHITVGKGCICVSWVIPDHINACKLVPELSLEFVDIMGVISLHIGDTVIYNIGGEGCETIEAAMLQAIELKNTRAVELLLAVGCSPDIVTEDNAVTTIVNIREKCDGNGGVNHVCILGHNEHIEAIVDPSRKPECISCSLKEKMVRYLQQENEILCKQSDTLVQQQKEDFSLEYEKKKQVIDAEDDELPEQLMGYAPQQKTKEILSESDMKQDIELMKFTDQLKNKDAVITLLKKENQALIMELANLKDATVAELFKQLESKDAELIKIKEELKNKRHEETVKLKEGIIASKSTAVLPRLKLSIGAKMKVKVITGDSSGMLLVNGGSAIRATLTCNIEECPVTDNGDGTYIISVIPHQLGEHQLSISVNGQYIQDSPFILTIVPQRDYTKLKDPVQMITGIRVHYPQCIAFSDNADMFVTNTGDDCIRVYDEWGNEKTTIGSKGNGELQFNLPLGIDINEKIVYVAEFGGHRIHMLTIKGEFIGIFGKEGSGLGQFYHPRDVKISPDGKVYVADSDNDRVQVFNPDWTISHVIDGRFIGPKGIAFDLSGDVHVTGHGSSSITVFTPTGQFVRQYNYNAHIYRPVGIAVDPSGYSLVTTHRGSLVVYDHTGRLICRVGNFNSPTGVSVSPGGSVWVADTLNDRLVKY